MLPVNKSEFLIDTLQQLLSTKMSMSWSHRSLLRSSKMNEGIYKCNGWKVWSSSTTSVPKSIPRFVLDKVRFYVPIWGFYLQFFMFRMKVPNKSLSQELNSVLFCSCCCKDELM